MKLPSGRAKWDMDLKPHETREKNNGMKVRGRGKKLLPGRAKWDIDLEPVK